MDERGIKDLHKCGEEMSKNSSLPNQEQQEQVSWMARAWEREGDKGAKEFCPGWSLLSRLEPPTGIKGHPFVSVGASNWDKMPLSPAGPVSRWTRDKNHILSRAQRLPGQMT